MELFQLGYPICISCVYKNVAKFSNRITLVHLFFFCALFRHFMCNHLFFKKLSIHLCASLHFKVFVSPFLLHIGEHIPFTTPLLISVNFPTPNLNEPPTLLSFILQKNYIQFSPLTPILYTNFNYSQHFLSIS